MKEKYDVVIVGTGVAGCFAALHLSENMDVLMITKGDLEESDSFLAQGGICVQKDDDDYDSFYEDTMRAGHYENRPESVDFMISSSRSVIEELIRYGVEFEREKTAAAIYERRCAFYQSNSLSRGYHGRRNHQQAS